jgi:hypothetical protein
MSDITSAEQYRRINFSWVPEVFFHPKMAFQRISSNTNAIWLTPLLILSFMVVINVIVEGRLTTQAAPSMGEITYPPDFQYYTPEQQAQYIQAIQSTQSPVFTYILPSLASLLGVWFGWLVLGGILHLVTTLFGGRGSTAISLNIVAWASLPLVLREVIQIIYTLSTQKLIISSGLSGFSPSGETGWPLLLGQILKLIDIYMIWQFALLILGTRISTGLNRSKSLLCVIISILVIFMLQVGIAYLGSVLGNLTITRPFFF